MIKVIIFSPIEEEGIPIPQPHSTPSEEEDTYIYKDLMEWEDAILEEHYCKIQDDEEELILDIEISQEERDIEEITTPK